MVAVTGGIASGKTALTERFEQLGIEVVDADRIARELVEPGQAALQEIVDRFGPSVLGADGRLDRAGLRARVFASAADRLALEAILHPRVRTRMRERAVAATGDYVLLAIPLLVESARYEWIERVLLVDVPVELQVQRVMRRDGVDAESARRTLAAQASRQQRLAVAQDVVVNDAGLDVLDRSVQRLDRLYRQLATKRGRPRAETDAATRP